MEIIDRDGVDTLREKWGESRKDDSNNCQPHPWREEQQEENNNNTET